MQKGVKRWLMERGYEEGRRTDLARHNLLSVFYVFVRRSAASDVPGADNDRTGNNGGIITYLLTPWSRVLREKLTGLQLVKKFPAFYM
jgi:hypothetical protein